MAAGRYRATLGKLVGDTVTPIGHRSRLRWCRSRSDRPCVAHCDAERDRRQNIEESKNRRIEGSYDTIFRRCWPDADLRPAFEGEPDRKFTRRLIRQALEFAIRVHPHRAKPGWASPEPIVESHSDLSSDLRIFASST